MNHSRNSIRKLTMLALLTAMSIVFARVLSISTGFVRFNLGSLPTLLAAVLFGPVEGFAVGAVADMIGGTLSGYAINPLITLGAGSIGLTAGLLWRALPNLRLGLRTQISVFAGHAVGSIVINSLALHLFYNYPWSVLVTRIPNALVLAAVNTVLVRLLLENTNLVVTRETILQVVWGTDISVERRTVDMHIRTLRKKLGDAGKAGEPICTLYADDDTLFAAAEEMYVGGLTIGAEKPEVPPLIYARVTSEGVERF